MIDMIQPISFADDPEDRKDGILEVGGEEVSADEADPDYTEYMTGGCNKNQHQDDQQMNNVQGKRSRWVEYLALISQIRSSWRTLLGTI